VSLGIAIKAPEGIVLAAESRLTLSAQQADGTGIYVNFDNATKLLALNGDGPHRHMGIVTYGLATIGLRAAQSFLPEFEATLPTNERLTVYEYASRLGQFFLAQWTGSGQPDPTSWAGPAMVFLVGGYDEGAAYGRVFEVAIPRAAEPVEKNAGEQFGITWGGQQEYVNRLIHGFDSKLLALLQEDPGLDEDVVGRVQAKLAQLSMPIPLLAMPLQDVVDLAIFFVRTTITAQTLSFGLRGCGGPIDVATVTRSGLSFIQRKQIQGESGPVGAHRRI
jgi:hypothetical protein